MYRLHELATAAERQPVDRRDYGLWITLDPAGQPMAGPHEMCDRVGGARFHMRLEFRNVGAGAERTTRSGDDDRAHGTVELHLVQCRRERADELVVERVEFLGSIQREHCDRPAVFDEQGMRHLVRPGWKPTMLRRTTGPGKQFLPTPPSLDPPASASELHPPPYW